MSWSAGAQRRRRGKTCLILIEPPRLLNNLPPHLLLSILTSRLLLKSSAHLLLSHLDVLLKSSLLNNCFSSSHTFHMLSSAPSSNLREGTCSSPLPTSKQPSPHFSHFSSPPRHHRTRAFLVFRLAPFSFKASASIRPASKIRIVFK